MYPQEGKFFPNSPDYSEKVCSGQSLELYLVENVSWRYRRARARATARSTAMAGAAPEFSGD